MSSKKTTLEDLDNAGLIISIVCTALTVTTLTWLFWKVRTLFTPTLILALIFYLLTILAMAARYALPIWSDPRLLIVNVSISLLELQLYYIVFKIHHLKA